MFQDRLRIPPVLHPGPQGTDESPALLRVRMLARRVRLHSAPAADIGLDL